MSNKIETKREMLRAGYTFRSHAACKSCGARIEWWRTTHGKNMPYNELPADQDAIVTPHWASCPDRDNFRSKADKAQEAKATREDAVHQLAIATGARAVIALYDEGEPALSWRRGIEAEDLKHEAITAANKLRWQIVTQGGKAI